MPAGGVPDAEEDLNGSAIFLPLSNSRAFVYDCGAMGSKSLQQMARGGSAVPLIAVAAVVCCGGRGDDVFDVSVKKPPIK